MLRSPFESPRSLNCAKLLSKPTTLRTPIRYHNTCPGSVKLMTSQDFVSWMEKKTGTRARTRTSRRSFSAIKEICRSLTVNIHRNQLPSINQVLSSESKQAIPLSAGFYHRFTKRFTKLCTDCRNDRRFDDPAIIRKDFALRSKFRCHDTTHGKLICSLP